MDTHTHLSLASVVQVRQTALQTIRLEEDLSQPGLTPAYLITSQVQAVLGRILKGFGSHRAARAWTLTGPYGSGKSYFNLFLMNLLDKTQPDHSATLHTLAQADPLLANAVETDYLNDSLGLFPIPITGYRAPLQDCLCDGVRRAVQHLAPKEDLAGVLERLASSSRISSRAFALALSDLSGQMTQYGYRGMLLVIDELGKLLEYAAMHPDSSDLYLLQEIAELANRSADASLVVIGILHQAFERYATFLDSLTQQEWAKVQGRLRRVVEQARSPENLLFVDLLEVLDLPT